MKAAPVREVIIIGGGIAGLSAAIYLGRAQRETVVIDSEKSLAVWEPDVENYLGFPDGISGKDLLKRGQRQARLYQARFIKDEVVGARRSRGLFLLRGRKRKYRAKRLLLATGLYHIPPAIQGVSECLGRSIFFCKDCDGRRVQGKRVLIYGWNNEAARYALGMLCYSGSVGIVTDGHAPKWDRKHARWLEEYQIPVLKPAISEVQRRAKQVRALGLSDGTLVAVDALFTTRGDIFYNTLARALGAKIDAEGQVEVDATLRTTVAGLYAAGCVTPANCQMVIAAGQGAAAAQAINRDLFEENLVKHTLWDNCYVASRPTETSNRRKSLGKQRTR